jgi:GT2 family glycosyltransferase
MYDYMEKNPAIGMLGPKVLNPDLSLQLSCRKFPAWGTCFAVLSAWIRFFHK